MQVSVRLLRYTLILRRADPQINSSRTFLAVLQGCGDAERGSGWIRDGSDLQTV